MKPTTITFSTPPRFSADRAPKRIPYLTAAMLAAGATALSLGNISCQSSNTPKSGWNEIFPQGHPLIPIQDFFQSKCLKQVPPSTINNLKDVLRINGIDAESLRCPMSADGRAEIYSALSPHPQIRTLTLQLAQKRILLYMEPGKNPEFEAPTYRIQFNGNPGISGTFVGQSLHFLHGDKIFRDKTGNIVPKALRADFNQIQEHFTPEQITMIHDVVNRNGVVQHEMGFLGDDVLWTHHESPSVEGVCKDVGWEFYTGSEKLLRGVLNFRTETPGILCFREDLKKWEEQGTIHIMFQRPDKDAKKKNNKSIHFKIHPDGALVCWKTNKEGDIISSTVKITAVMKGVKAKPGKKMITAKIRPSIYRRRTPGPGIRS